MQSFARKGQNFHSREIDGFAKDKVKEEQDPFIFLVELDYLLIIPSNIGSQAA